VENFASILDYHADRRPDKVVVTHLDTSVTNAELLRRVNALAEALREAGVVEGDVVALLLPNGIEFIEAIFAINRLGAAFLPINIRLAPAEWEYILHNSEASAVFSAAEFVPHVNAALGRLTRLRTTIVVGEEPVEGWANHRDLVESYLGAWIPVVDVEGTALQRLMYTSGTTSRPKGVCISHANVLAKNLGLIVEFGLTDQDVTAVAGPLYHVGALDMGGVATLHTGGSLVLQARFDAPDLIDLMARSRTTTVWLAPAMVNALLQEPSLADADLTSLRVIMSGGEKMPEARLKQILDLLPHVRFADAYGLTETCSSDTFVPVDFMHAKLGSVGKPIPHQQVRVGDSEGLDLPPGVIGEILVRGPKVFAGYWRDAKATQDAFLDGWFRTGDLGRIDEDGFLYIEDRKKDMIVSGGENIASPEVERVLYEHPDVVEAAVVGPGSDLTPEAVRDFCRERLAKFKAPAYTTIVTALPRTASGKVIKRDLRTLPEVVG
jgi:fatty-acyl-CoA synthase